MAKFWDRWADVQHPADMPYVLRQAAHDLFEVDVAIGLGDRPPDHELHGLLDDTHALLCYAAGIIRSLLGERRP